ncbi:hypothetical protein NEILACOT_04752 [Neisseria lactamica ATCC 23970]|uniref:DUF4189 domain-containing protein n=1 Tax=Neisseria lactamica ATCC 23970 TaxID=546265 RepID=D0WB28_NEILA|nr:DUF4189 domain-containing protein [Neisseria lactamica]EEZ75195.1 hypothetical protein NEILACOT_04752 [Neisseria lactamica ATCC 23970]KFJ36763.1 hypothetical protein DR91_261 [Neisseria lactamica ATCC 23970]VTQ48150.1 Uncharacterised protein [Neisseria lactamica]
MIKRMAAVSVLCLMTAAAQAADTYGYLAVWQNPQNTDDVLQIKATKEDSTQNEALAELEAFCKGQDTLAGIGGDQATGCRSVVSLNNTCVALAYPKALGAMSVENAVVITSPRFTSVHQVALNQCIKKYGVQGQCALETVYCTSSSYYGGTVRSLIQNLK